MIFIIKSVFGVRGKLLAIAFLHLVGCAFTNVHHGTVESPAGRYETQDCSASCVQKIETSDGGEKCLKFTAGMAGVCFEEKDKPMPKGTYVHTNPA